MSILSHHVNERKTIFKNKKNRKKLPEYSNFKILCSYSYLMHDGQLLPHSIWWNIVI